MGYTSVDVRSISDSEKDKPCYKAGDILISGLTLPLSVRAQIIAIKFSIKWLSETSDRKMCKGVQETLRLRRKNITSMPIKPEGHIYKRQRRH